MSKSAKIVMLRLKVEVEYHNRFGAICPACKTANTCVATTLGWLDGGRRRYHECIHCHARFTSWEVEMEPPPEPIKEVVKPRSRKPKKTKVPEPDEPVQKPKRKRKKRGISIHE